MDRGRLPTGTRNHEERRVYRLDCQPARRWLRPRHCQVRQRPGRWPKQPAGGRWQRRRENTGTSNGNGNNEPKIYVTTQTCQVTQVKAEGSNADACIGIVSRSQWRGERQRGTVQHREGLRPVDREPERFPVQGFFGYSDWDFGAKQNNGGGYSQGYPLNLLVNSQTLTWSVDGSVLDNFDMFMIVVKQANDLSTYLFTDSTKNSGTWSFGFFNPAGWSHLSIYVRGTNDDQGDCSPTDPNYPTCEPPNDVPEPGSLCCSGLGLLDSGRCVGKSGRVPRIPSNAAPVTSLPCDTNNGYVVRGHRLTDFAPLQAVGYFYRTRWTGYQT